MDNERVADVTESNDGFDIGNGITLLASRYVRGEDGEKGQNVNLRLRDVDGQRLSNDEALDVIRRKATRLTAFVKDEEQLEYAETVLRKIGAGIGFKGLSPVRRLAEDGSLVRNRRGNLQVSVSKIDWEGERRAESAMWSGILNILDQQQG